MAGLGLQSQYSMALFAPREHKYTPFMELAC